MEDTTISCPDSASPPLPTAHT